MAFLNSIWLWTGLGLGAVAVPVAIHLLNRFYGRRTDWAAMELLRRALVTRANQVRLEDLLMLCLRCLVLLLLALAFARPTLRHEAGKWIGGQRRVGVLIALDASYSMAHGEFSPRFSRAVSRARDILETVEVGDPVTIVRLGSQPRILLSSGAYVPEQVRGVLDQKLAPVPERLHLEPCLEQLEELARELKAPAKECYLITDAQALTWETLSDRARASLRQLAAEANLFLVQVAPEGEENLAVVSLEFVAGTLRQGGTARFAAAVRNSGTKPAAGATVTFHVNGEAVARQPVEAIAPGQTKVLSFVAGLAAPGDVRLSAELSPDALVADNVRYAVVRVPASVRVLSVDGDRKPAPFASETDYLAAAVRVKSASQSGAVVVNTIGPAELAAENLRDYEVVVLANVPHLPPEHVARLFAFVREGGGLFVTLGENVEAELYNAQFRAAGETLLPGELGGLAEGPAADAAGWSLAPPRARHPLAAFAEFLPPDLLSAGGFRRAFRVKPGPGALEILKFAESELPLLLEKSLGRGTVLLFTTTADREWTDFPTQPLYPILMQQAITYLTHAGARRQFTVGEPFFLPADELAAGQRVVLRGPTGKDVLVPVVARDGRLLASAEPAAVPGFYALRRADGQELPGPVAVNVDPTEADVKVAGQAALESQWAGIPVRFVTPAAPVASAVRESRVGRELGGILLVLALAALVVQSLMAKHFTKRIAGGRGDLSRSVQQQDVIAARKA